MLERGRRARDQVLDHGGSGESGMGGAASGGGERDHTTSSFESTLKWNTIFRNCSPSLDAVGGSGAGANFDSLISLN